MTMTGLFHNGFGGKLPGMSINNGNALRGRFHRGCGRMPWNNANPTYTYRDQIAKIWGRHNIYAGFYFAPHQKNEQTAQRHRAF